MTMMSPDDAARVRMATQDLEHARARVLEIRKECDRAAQRFAQGELNEAQHSAVLDRYLLELRALSAYFSRRTPACPSWCTHHLVLFDLEDAEEMDRHVHVISIARAQAVELVQVKGASAPHINFDLDLEDLTPAAARRVARAIEELCDLAERV